MYYEINVSLNGQHFFATAKRSITDEKKLKQVLAVLVAKFPMKEGYDLVVESHIKSGCIKNIGEYVEPSLLKRSGYMK